ncbi:MAG: DNA polymerase III subunit gamma and tau [Corynebacterium provencense]|uniref:DNA polymerase III subunit gamma and tau n=1 Tax=Corynebacterium provencense TaxID=1737425 RepID=UPI002989EBCC|nr:DNA polymerase III subunit gamma and tau [Corynebacterium provencense]
MALYRKYRPATFAEVVGQEHVTVPLCTSLDSGRINHAYLFSGPRGCGKTSSARILARSLNCVEGPTSTPCGVCDSCVALAPGGPGTLDVTELDAATHNGVDDMRELRDRAFYAPAESRYRVFIIDEAHMISSAGFNALLKIVEEPPEHLIFIFATTEPEKLLPTIRSRTHNYPFRLLTPPTMRSLLEKICGEEGVEVEDAVYPLVIRAGGGSPRDSLSVMDQLLAGAGPEGVTYRRAVALLGVTDSALIDRAVDALADSDQAGLFSVVSDVIDAGHDPRRFATDLLDRFRDLLVVQAVPDAFDSGLVDAPADLRETLTRQAEELGTATLTRCATLVNEGLMQMRGATSPRLLLEILCARMALPAAGMTLENLAQRVEALESGQRAPQLNDRAPGPGDGGTAGGPARYVRKSRRRQDEGQDGRGSDAVVVPPTEPVMASPTPEAAGEATVARPPAAEQDASPVSDSVPDTAPGQSPIQSPNQSLGQAPVEAAATGDLMTEAERAREIMRRNRRRAAEDAAPVRTPDVAQNKAQNEARDDAQNVVRNEVPGPEESPVPGTARNEAPTTAPAAPSTEPAPASVPDPALSPSQEAVNRWADVLEAVRATDLSAWIAARDATPSPGEPTSDGTAVVVLHHHTGALANFINDPAHAEAYASAAGQVTGFPVTVRAVVGGQVNPGPSGSGPRQAAPRTPVPEAPGDDGEPTDPVEPPGKAEAAAAEGAEPHQPAQRVADLPPAQVGDHEAVRTAAEDPGLGRSGSHTPESAPVDPVSVALARARGHSPLVSGTTSPAAQDTGRPENSGPETAGPETAGPVSSVSASGSPASSGTVRNATTTATPAVTGTTSVSATADPGEGQELTGWRARMARTGRMRTAAQEAADNGFNGIPLPDEPSEPWDDGPGDPAHADPGAGGPDPYDQRAEAEEALAQLDDRTPGHLDHRSALEIAGELLEKHLGAERTR